MEVDEEAKKEEEEKEEEEEAEEPEEEDPEPEKETAKLTAEEEKAWFRPMKVPDLTPSDLNKYFVKFSLPQKTEGFDEVRYEWQQAAKCKERLDNYVADKKLTAKMEDLTPSEWFSDKWKSWQKAVQSWQSRVSMYKAQVIKKEDERRKKIQAREQKKKAREALKAAKEKQKAEKARL